MRSASAVFALAAVSGALAQIPAPIQSFIGNLSSSCQQSVLSLATSSNLTSCLNIPQALPILTQAFSASNTTSLVPLVNQLVAVECGNPGCSNATLTSAYNTIAGGCSTDLAKYNVTNSTLRTIFQQYPLAREVVCLQTTIPFNTTTNMTTSYSNSSTNGTSSSTNGTYCATSLLNEVQYIVGQNLSINFFTGLAQAYMAGNLTNATFAQLGSRFNTSLLCNDCIFAAADVIGVAYPAVGNVTLRSLGLGRTFNFSSANTTYTSNTTVAQALNSTCSAQGLVWNSNGTLPSTILLGAVNSTFGYNLTAANGTRAAPSNPIPIRRNVANIKARWIGEHF